MKNLVLALLSLLLVGCGGNVSPRPSTPLSATITSADVFNTSMIGETWTFHNGYGDATTISIEPAPPVAAGFAGNNVVFHYRKENARSYWNPGTPDAELWFVLHQQVDNSWTSTASLIIFPESCVFCTDPPNWTSLTTNTRPIDGKPIPYAIIPASVTRGETSTIDTMYELHMAFNTKEPDFSDITLTQPPVSQVPWRNSFYSEYVSVPAYTGPAMVSEQWEGPCFPVMQPGCAHEKWYFAPALGLVQVVPLNIGAGDNADPQLTMYRD